MILEVGFRLDKVYSYSLLSTYVMGYDLSNKHNVLIKFSHKVQTGLDEY